jgi:hypothetical protein
MNKAKLRGVALAAVVLVALAVALLVMIYAPMR